MSNNYEAYEKECDRIHKENEKHLTAFEEWLRNKGLSEKTIERHASNVDFYINEYLCYYDALDVRHGCYSIGMFLGDWFIRKAMWSSCTSIKANAVGIKKFYEFLLECDVIEQQGYDTLCKRIKEGMPEWLDKMRHYYDDVEDY